MSERTLNAVDLKHWRTVTSRSVDQQAAHTTTLINKLKSEGYTIDLLNDALTSAQSVVRLLVEIRTLAQAQYNIERNRDGENKEYKYDP